MKKDAKILIACEESGTIVGAFRARGSTNVWSCDLLPTSGKFPEWHIQGDVAPILQQHWDLVIAHPPCTYLTITGNRWFSVERYGDKALKRIEDREEARVFFMLFANAKCDKICIENPLGFMSTYFRKPDQIIQPYMFGEPLEKKTCLWLKGLPLLKPTNLVKPPPRTQFKSGKSMPSWYAEVWHLPKEQRSIIRSKTFQGIADAMATQWSDI